MNLRVEFYGIPRSRAGVSDVVLTFETPETTFGEVVSEIANQFPQFAFSCVLGDRLLPSFSANINGDRFVNDPAMVVHHGDTILLLSSDAGG